MNCLVLLSGCGVKDGSCPEEVALTYTALEKYGCAYQPVADDIPVLTVDHLTGQPDQERQICSPGPRDAAENSGCLLGGLRRTGDTRRTGSADQLPALPGCG